MGVREWFSGAAIRDKVERAEIYQEALEFARNYQPNPNINYDWVATHAANEYQRLEERIDTLDSKADGLIRYLGAGSGLISLVFAHAVPAKGWLAAAQIFPALFAVFAAVVCAARARAPEKPPLPLHTRSAFKYADAYQENAARASFAAMTGVASIGLTLALTEKARLVRWAFRLFILAVFWLVAMAAVIAARGFSYPS